MLRSILLAVFNSSEDLITQICTSLPNNKPVVFLLYRQLFLLTLIFALIYTLILCNMICTSVTKHTSQFWWASELN
jgi:hypothetical protein